MNNVTTLSQLCKPDTNHRITEPQLPRDFSSRLWPQVGQHLDYTLLCGRAMSRDFSRRAFAPGLYAPPFDSQPLFATVAGGASRSQVILRVGATFTDWNAVVNFQHDIGGELSTILTGEVVPLQYLEAQGIPTVADPSNVSHRTMIHLTGEKVKCYSYGLQGHLHPGYYISQGSVSMPNYKCNYRCKWRD